MKSEKKIPITEKGFPKNKLIILGAIVILVGIILFSNFSTVGSVENSDSLIRFDATTSGPFTINKTEYGIDELLFFTVSGIAPNEYGEAHFIKPDGEVNHKILFDGRKSLTLNHYFTPAQRENLENCPKCNLIGNWTISFRMFEGPEYPPIQLRVTDDDSSELE